MDRNPAEDKNKREGDDDGALLRALDQFTRTVAGDPEADRRAAAALIDRALGGDPERFTAHVRLAQQVSTRGLR